MRLADLEDSREGEERATWLVARDKKILELKMKLDKMQNKSGSELRDMRSVWCH